MNKITDDFDEFVEEISLNESLKKDIISKHNSLGDMIKKEAPDGYTIERILLSGSYAKHTVLNEYDKDKKPDVDMIVIIKDENQDVDTVNSDFLTYFKDKKGSVVSEIRQQSNSIGLIYSNISVDIVIATYDEQKETLKIASNKKHTWVESNALKHIGYMKDKKATYEGFSYYSLMKLFKYLNKEIYKTKIKSYTLEQLIHLCTPYPSVGTRLHQAFVETVNNISKLSSIYEIRDCCDNSKKGYDDKDIDVFEDFKALISETADLANSAIEGNRKDWEKIFGDRFPEQPDKKVENNAKYDKTQTPWCNNKR